MKDALHVSKYLYKLILRHDEWCHSCHAGPGSHGIQSLAWHIMRDAGGHYVMQSGARASLITAGVTDTGHRMHYQGSAHTRLCANYDFNLSDQSGDDDISDCVNMILLLILLSQVSAQSRPPKFKTLFYPQSPSSKPSAAGGGYTGPSPSPTPAYSPPQSPSSGTARPHITGCHLRYHHHHCH